MFAKHPYTIYKAVPISSPLGHIDKRHLLRGAFCIAAIYPSQSKRTATAVLALLLPRFPVFEDNRINSRTF